MSSKIDAVALHGFLDVTTGRTVAEVAAKFECNKATATTAVKLLIAEGRAHAIGTQKTGGRGRPNVLFGTLETPVLPPPEPKVKAPRAPKAPKAEVVQAVTAEATVATDAQVVEAVVAAPFVQAQTEAPAAVVSVDGTETVLTNAQAEKAAETLFSVIG